MSSPVAILVFLASLLLTLSAAGFFADRLDHVGPRVGLPEPVVGLLTALAADAPEIASAIVAIVHGQRNVGLGVVLGSNAFNLAAMVGLTAVVTGSVSVDRRSLAIEGVVALTATIISAATVVGLLGSGPALGLIAAAAGAYLVLMMRGPVRPFSPKTRSPGHRLAKLEALIVPAVGLIVVGAYGMVRSALVLSSRWHIPATVVGLVVLAILTSLPNAFTALRLGVSGRGGALVSETMASNTINLIGGILLPALVLGVAEHSTLIVFDFAWVLVMTVGTIAFLARPTGAGRRGGAVLVGLYVAFVVVQVVSG